MKKSVILFIFCSVLSACFYTHKAKRIDRYELTKPKKNVVKLTAYTFQFTGNNTMIKPIVHAFFDLKANSPIYDFKTESLIDGEKVEVYMTSNSDKDKTVGLVNVFNFFNRHEDTDIEPAKYSKPLVYFHIQVMGEKGEDLLAEHTLRKKVVLAKLNALRRQLNN